MMVVIPPDGIDGDVANWLLTETKTTMTMTTRESKRRRKKEYIHRFVYSLTSICKVVKLCNFTKWNET